MAQGKGTMWDFFWKGDKQNSNMYKAHCLGCIHHQMGNVQLSNTNTLDLSNETVLTNSVLNLLIRYLNTNSIIACQAVGSVLGEKKAMIAPILGGQASCPHASTAVTAWAKALRGKLQEEKHSNATAGDADNDIEEAQESGLSQK